MECCCNHAHGKSNAIPPGIAFTLTVMGLIAKQVQLLYYHLSNEALKTQISMQRLNYKKIFSQPFHFNLSKHWNNLKHCSQESQFTNCSDQITIN